MLQWRCLPALLTIPRAMQAHSGAVHVLFGALVHVMLQSEPEHRLDRYACMLGDACRVP